MPPFAARLQMERAVAQGGKTSATFALELKTLFCLQVTRKKKRGKKELSHFQGSLSNTCFQVYNKHTQRYTRRLCVWTSRSIMTSASCIGVVGVCNCGYGRRTNDREPSGVNQPERKPEQVRRSFVYRSNGHRRWRKKKSTTPK